MGTHTQEDNPYFVFFMKAIVGVLLVVLGAILFFGIIEMFKAIF